ncbi:Nickel uptake substrate-specific transmembrane region [Planctomycetes bacterium Pla163]|uniref:Nickel uptake substrate-specific transmembrane region n=1 Tax=Rohdeia mirabilis TaxID=2528008 RepID=A0A518CW21_9BACT|nr:Nickel uptake substrate-specific transmembrane region [Planctomycetes bacterium Pla163]
MNSQNPRSRSNPTLLLVLVVALAAVAGLVWMLTGDDGAPDRIGSVDRVEGEQDELADVDLASTAESTGDDERADVGASVDELEANVAGAVAVLVEGRVEAPPGTPSDERLVVFAVDRQHTLRALVGGDATARRAFDLATSGADPDASDGDASTLLGTTLVESDGSFRLDVPAGTRAVHLAVTGRYVYSLATTSVALPARKLVVLTGELGAWVTGAVVPPLEAAAAGERIAAGLGVEFGPDVLSGFDMSAIATFGTTRETETRDGGAFEFRAVPAVGAYGLLVRPEGYAVDLELGLRLEPGEHRVLEAVLGRGALVRGRVVDEAGAGIGGAQVQARYRGALSNAVGTLAQATTRADGSFELRNVAAGVVDLIASAERRLETRERFDFEFVDGAVHDGVVVVLTRGASISGRVEFPDGSPAAGASVVAGADLSRLGGGGMTGADIERTRGSNATTDADGRFTLEGLSDSVFALTARADTSTPAPVDDTDAAPERDAPRGDVWRARAKNVEPGPEPVVLVLERLEALRGRVVAADDGEPLADFSVRATLAGSGAMFGIGAERREKSFESADDGYFALFDLEPGAWEIEVGAEGRSTSARREIDVPQAEGADVPVFELALAAGVAGIVVDPAGTPVAGAGVSVRLDLARRIEAMQSGGVAEVFTDVDGRFLLEQLSPGSLNLVADLDGYAASAPTPVDAVAGVTTQDVVIALRRGGTLTGQVFGEDGQPSKGRMVSVQDMPDYAFQRIVTTDDDGAFELESLEPGKWQVIATPNYMDDDSSLDDDDGGAAELFAQLKMATVDIVEDETVHVVLGAPPANPVDLRGRVLYAGEPVEGAMISALSEAGDGDTLSRLKMIVTDADGAFEVRLDEAGPLHLTVQSGMEGGGQNSIEFVENVPVGATEHDVVLELPGASIAGRVTSAAGEPLSGVRVTVTPDGATLLGNSLGGNHVETLTDADGRYEARYLRPDSYSVAAGGAAFAGMLGGGSVHGRATRAGVHVSDGERFGPVDFVLEPAVKLTGRVIDGSGAPVAGASVFARGEDGALVDRISYVTSDAAGRFGYDGLAAGTYRVSARKGERVSLESQPFAIDAESTGEPVLTLEQGTVLVVRIAAEDGPVHDVRVSVTDDGGHEFAGLLSMSEMLADLGRAASSTERRVGPLAPGAYTVAVTHPDGRSRSRRVSVDGQAEKAVSLRLK